MSLRVCIVGAGAVGQVYGLHLQRGGAEVTFLVREKYREETAAGMVLHPLRDKGSHDTLVPHAVITDPAELADGYDQVWLCVPTNALASGALDAHLEAIASAPNTTLVSMLPGAQVRAMIEARFPHPARVVDGLIGMIAYHAPLPGESISPEGTAFVLPRLSPSKFSGASRERVDAIVKTLKRGGCPAKRVDDARVSLAFSSSMMMPMIVALEGAGWSLSGIRKGPWLGLAAGTAKEAMAVIGKELGVRPPLIRMFVGRWLFSFISRIAPRIAPFDAEVYLKYHFTKVGEQTRLMMREYISGAQRYSLPSEATEELNTAVFGSSET